jgi:hypothetical protein
MFGSDIQCPCPQEMSEPTDLSARVAERKEGEARAASIWRALFVVFGLALIELFRPPDSPVLGAAFHLLLLGAAFWAMRPGLTGGGQRFMERGHWSSFCGVPPLIVGYFLVRDLVAIARIIKS